MRPTRFFARAPALAAILGALLTAARTGTGSGPAVICVDDDVRNDFHGSSMMRVANIFASAALAVLGLFCVEDATAKTPGTNIAPTVPLGCGTAYGAHTSTAPSAGLCTGGFALTGAVAAGSGQYKWSCKMSPLPVVACKSFQSIIGACGTANGVLTSAAPSANLCGAGTATPVTPVLNGSMTTAFNWLCLSAPASMGPFGNNAACSAPAPSAGSCGTAYGKWTLGAPSATPASNLCASGAATTPVSSVIAGTTTWSWNCQGTGTGSNAGSATCTAPQVTQVAGSFCGPSSGVTLSTPPSSLCVPGTSASSITTTTGGFSWTCSFSTYGGTQASVATSTCTAP